MEEQPPGAAQFMSERRVVVTGIGVLSPLGNDLASTWDGLTAGRSGIAKVSCTDPSSFPCQIAGEVRDFDPKPYFTNPKDARRADRFAHFAVAASRMALEDSGLDLEGVDRDRVGVMLGSGIGGLATLEEQHRVLLDKGPPRVSPTRAPGSSGPARSTADLAPDDDAP